MEIEWSGQMQPDKVIKMNFNWKCKALFFFYRNCNPIPSDRSVEHVQLHLFTEMSGTPQDLTVIIRRDQSNLISPCHNPIMLSTIY